MVPIPRVRYLVRSYSTIITGEDTASTLGIPELIGIGVGMAIAVVLVLLCCLLVVCALASKCK